VARILLVLKPKELNLVATDSELLAWVAEDDAEMRRMIAGLLRRSGFRVDEFLDGKELLERIEMLDRGSSPVEEPSLIILDHLMPEVHGLDAAARLKNLKSDIPFIVITAFGDAQVHRRARLLGAAAILDKPFDLNRLRGLAIEAARADGRSTPHEP
jgi:CheY-like chemotaxis protein